MREEFHAAEQEEAIGILSTYDYYEGERVLNTALNLANGNLEELRQLIQVANVDYRDILSADRSQKEIRQSKFIIVLVITIIVVVNIVQWLNE